MYKLVKDFLTNTNNKILRIADNAFIPFDLDNTDYIAYLEWCKENTPLPAENT